MKINIASYGGRNWLLDLARELDRQGHQVKFYSYLPHYRASKFGLRRQCNSSYFILAIPFLILMRLSKNAHWSVFIFHWIFDNYVGLTMSPCDIFIGQSPMHNNALLSAKRRFGASVVIERGTRHVKEQIVALAENPLYKGKSPMPEMFIRRDLLGYQIADYITVPSEVVKNSFLDHNILESKIFINPFGVNISNFRPTTLDTAQEVYDLIIVGQWCHRKGCDLLARLCEEYNYKLLHVGAVVDLPFPVQHNMVHIDPIEEFRLVDYYSKAKVFVLPSREEGLALVQVQALACGLPIVCSQYTGGRDLKKFTMNPKWILEMDELTIQCLRSNVELALELANSQEGARSYSTCPEQYFSWQAYGERYHKFLTDITNCKL